MDNCVSVYCRLGRTLLVKISIWEMHQGNIHRVSIFRLNLSLVIHFLVHIRKSHLLNE